MIDMNLDFLVNAVVCDYPSLASITFRTMKGEELVLNYWNGDGYDWDDHLIQSVIKRISLKRFMPNSKISLFTQNMKMKKFFRIL